MSRGARKCALKHVEENALTTARGREQSQIQASTPPISRRQRKKLSNVCLHCLNWVFIVVRKNQQCNIVQYHCSRKSNSYILGTSWITPEKMAVNFAFSHHIKGGTLPSMKECRRLIQEHSPLKKRTPAVIKTHVSNETKRRRRLPTT